MAIVDYDSKVHVRGRWAYWPSPAGYPHITDAEGNRICASGGVGMKMIVPCKITLSKPDAEGRVSAKVDHLQDPVVAEPLYDRHGKEKVSARDQALREMKARVLEADARWIRSGGVGLREIEATFAVEDLAGVPDQGVDLKCPFRL